jgi:hypothetical protein
MRDDFQRFNNQFKRFLSFTYAEGKFSQYDSLVPAYVIFRNARRYFLSIRLLDSETLLAMLQGRFR